MNISTYKKKVNKTALRWILQKSKSQLPSIILLVVIYAILAIIGVYVAIASKYLVNAATGNDPSYANDPLGGVAHRQTFFLNFYQYKAFCYHLNQDKFHHLKH